MERNPSDFDFPCSPTWRGYYNERYGYAGVDYDPSPLKGEGKHSDTAHTLAVRMEAMERQVNFLYANLAMKATHKEEQTVWKPSDGLAAREV